MGREPRRNQRSGCTSLHCLGLSSSSSSSPSFPSLVSSFLSFIFYLFSITCYSFRCSPVQWSTNPVRKYRHPSTADKFTVTCSKLNKFFLQLVPSSELVLFCWWRTKIS